MDSEMQMKDVQQICVRHQIEVEDLQMVTGSFGKKIFLINQEFLLRVSQNPMTHELGKFKRVAALAFVPRVIHTGTIMRENGPIYYILLNLLAGDDFVNLYQTTTKGQQRELGVNTAEFLDRLHQLEGRKYDIGLYVPALPDFPGSWREGHQHYWDILQQESETIPLSPDHDVVFEAVFRYLRASMDALDFQSGPRLLHNDFHPKNILLHQGKFSGVIDWECSQYGEADFELCHLIHWCLYPPDSTIDFRTFLQSLFRASPLCTRVPDLARRLAIYQVEHEIQQIIWSGGQAASMRVPRLARWMDGGVEELMIELAV
ncbi:MAG: aminoglycoside phosphotransferase family protein [Anaerolineae bacterium]|nr:aminoglycoside phosphotransferase family protein [Anaerolineae bacterium]